MDAKINATQVVFFIILRRYSGSVMLQKKCSGYTIGEVMIKIV